MNYGRRLANNAYNRKKTFTLSDGKAVTDQSPACSGSSIYLYPPWLYPPRVDGIKKKHSFPEKF
jgi:hypothetical protein